MLDNLPRGTIVIEDIEIGMFRYLRKQVTDEDIEMFATVSTDRNPVHLIGEQLPGHGTVYLGQTMKFLRPVRPGDTVYAEVKVTDIDPAKRIVKMDCHCSVDGKKVLIGEATVLAPSRKFD
mgnify:CR=1 FL=1